MIFEKMSDHQNPPVKSRSLLHFDSLPQIQSERLFHINIFPFAKSSQSEPVMSFRRSGDNDSIDLRTTKRDLKIPRNLDSRSEFPRQISTFFIRIADQPKSAESMKISDKIFPPVTAPKNGDFRSRTSISQIN